MALLEYRYAAFYVSLFIIMGIAEIIESTEEVPRLPPPPPFTKEAPLPPPPPPSFHLLKQVNEVNENFYKILREIQTELLEYNASLQNSDEMQQRNKDFADRMLGYWKPKCPCRQGPEGIPGIPGMKGYVGIPGSPGYRGSDGKITILDHCNGIGKWLKGDTGEPGYCLIKR